MRFLLGLAAAFICVLAGAATAHAAAAPPGCDQRQAVEGPSRQLAWRAELFGRTPVRARLARPAQTRVDPVDATALLVLGAPRVADGRCWVRVRLPARPNDASAWVDTSRIELTETRWRIEVDRGARTLDVMRNGRRVRRFRVVVGAPGTSTPAGHFAVADAYRWRPSAFLGAWILTISAHSTVLDTFDGGDGRVALHGRGGTSLLDPLGSARSHGCVRLTNAAIGWLVRTIGHARLPGTPVRIT